MKIQKLFEVLVVGGAAVVAGACDGVEDGPGESATSGAGAGTATATGSAAGGGGGLATGPSATGQGGSSVAPSGAGGAGGSSVQGTGGSSAQGAGGSSSLTCSTPASPADPCGCPCCWVEACDNTEPCCASFCGAGNQGQGCCG